MKSKGGYPFNVRVYGILVQNKRVLVTDELIGGASITKFPGGGLEFGEGTLNGLEREFREELEIGIEIKSHFYTTDFFVKSAFNQSQVIAIYYLITTSNELNLKFSEVPLNFDKTKIGNQQLFRWIPLDEISEKQFTFATDKKVGELLRNI